MKTILILLLTAILTLAIAEATDIRFIWDPNAPEENITEYRIYSIGAERKLLWAGTGTETADGITSDIIDHTQTTTYVVTAVNEIGIESPDSDPLLVGIPSKVTNLKVTIEIQIQ